MRNAFSRWEALFVLAAVVILCVCLYPNNPKAENIEKLIADRELARENSLELDDKLRASDIPIDGTWKSQNNLYALKIHRKHSNSDKWACDWIIYPDKRVQIILTRDASYADGVLRVTSPIIELKDLLVYDRFFVSRNRDSTPVLVASVIVRQFENHLDHAGKMDFITESLVFTRAE